MSSAASEDPDPALSWGTRAWAAIGRCVRRIFEPLDGPAPPTPPPKQARLTHRQTLGPVSVPARGGVFDFQVYVSLTWTTQSLRPDELKDWARELWVLPYREVKRMATDLAARYAPYRAADLEARLNRRLASRPRQFHRSRNTVDCRSEVNVRLDDRLRKHLQPVWEKMAVMEAEHEVNRRRAELVADLNHRWLAILEQLPDTAVAPAAARLTDRQFADVVRQLAEDRRDTVDRLMAVLEILRRDGQANDRASGQIIELLISALRDQLGGLAEKSRRGRSNTPPWPRTDPDSTR